MAPILGKDADFQWNGVAISDIESIEFNGAPYDEEDTTAMNDAAHEVTFTLQNPQVTVVCRRNSADIGQNALITDSNAKTPRAVKVYEDGSKYWTWNGYAKYTISAPVGGVVKMTITVSGTSDGAVATYN
jgi:hypothetical protein